MKRNFFFLSLILLISCDHAVYKKSVDFDNNRWMRDEARTFEFDISESGGYDISINFSHVYGAPITEIPLEATLKGTAENTTQQVMLKLADKNGKSLSDCAGDVCDLKQKIIENEKLLPGHYTFSLRQHFDYDYLPNAIAVGIEVVKSGNQ